jgi:hypothetical protein
METVAGSFHPEMILEHYKYLTRFIPIGEENQIKKKALYKKYKDAVDNYDEDYKTGKKEYCKEKSFERITRKLCEAARKTGWKILYNTKGIWIAKDEEEYQKFKASKITEVKKIIQELAYMEQVDVKNIISEVFQREKKRSPQLEKSLFEEVA